MARDIVYYYDKLTFKQFELGEIQTNFNLSMVIDGTKDSMKVEVFSFEESEIEPWTLISHPATDTWWIIAHDKTERYLNEGGAFLYKHTLSLLGAIDLLNARDLTDCGFYQNRYTIESFIERIIKLSTFEYDYLLELNGLDEDKVVDYIKTYENYTPLSALRDFFDGYNTAVKLRFTTKVVGDDTYIDKAVLYTIPKTGKQTGSKQMTYFDDVRETKTMDKESFGTAVLSNADNVVSTKAKTYPSNGAARVFGTEYLLNYTNAVLRLPSNIFKVNWLKLCIDNFTIFVGSSPSNTLPISSSFWFNGTAYDDKFKVFLKETIYSEILNSYGQSEANNFLENINQIINDTQLFTTIKFYGNVKYDGVNDNLYFPPDAPSDAKTPKYYNTNNFDSASRVALMDKESRDLFTRPDHTFWYEKGKNIIHCLDGYTGSISGKTSVWESRPYADQNAFGLMAEGGTYLFAFYRKIYVGTGFNVYIYRSNAFNYIQPSRQARPSNQSQTPYDSQYRIIVNYIPMSDLKIKLENQRDKRDISVYNQNGKTTDSVALSKLLNSHAKEISSDTITRFKHYYSFTDIPSVGTVVYKDNVEYVINNISYTFFQNEETNNQNKVSYYIECEFTMSKNVGVKSLMVNPNSNIRDYGIPQSNTIKRKQLYRDYYEIDIEEDLLADDDFLVEFADVVNFPLIVGEQNNYTCLIKASANYYKYNEDSDDPQYSVPVSNAYFQIDGTEYVLKKAMIVSFDFNDNNIIGYDNQNVGSGFDLTRLFDQQSITITSPVSYVDQDGVVEGLELLITTQKMLSNDSSNAAQNNRCFISQTYYEDNESAGYLFKIQEPHYDKDPLETPVFEYCFQIGNSDNIIVGENILDLKEGDKYYYGFIISSQHTITENNAEKYAQNEINFIPLPVISNAANINNGLTQTHSEIVQHEISQHLGGRTDTLDFEQTDSYVERTIAFVGTFSSVSITNLSGQTTSVDWEISGQNVVFKLRATNLNTPVACDVVINSYEETTITDHYTNVITISLYNSFNGSSYSTKIDPSQYVGKQVSVFRYKIKNPIYDIFDITQATQDQLKEFGVNAVVLSTLQSHYYVVDMLSSGSYSYHQASNQEIRNLVEAKDLMFSIKNLSADNIDENNDIKLYVNHYKLN